MISRQRQQENARQNTIRKRGKETERRGNETKTPRCTRGLSLLFSSHIKTVIQASENGTIQLYKKMQGENLAREAEIAELRDRLNREKAELAERLEKEKNEMKERLEKENQELKDKLANEKQFLQVDG